MIDCWTYPFSGREFMRPFYRPDILLPRLIAGTSFVEMMGCFERRQSRRVLVENGVRRRHDVDGNVCLIVSCGAGSVGYALYWLVCGKLDCCGEFCSMLIALCLRVEDQDSRSKWRAFFGFALPNSAPASEFTPNVFTCAFALQEHRMIQD